MNSSVKIMSVSTFLLREAPVFAASFPIAGGIRPWTVGRGSRR